MKFELGQCVATRGAQALMEARGIEFFDLLRRHVRGDWGDLDAEDKAANDRAVKEGARILSAYNFPNGARFWVITEWDRSATTILLPDEY